MNDATVMTQTETLYVRKWSNPDARDRGDLPSEITVVKQVTTLEAVETATDTARITELDDAARTAETEVGE